MRRLTTTGARARISMSVIWNSCGFGVECAAGDAVRQASLDGADGYRIMWQPLSEDKLADLIEEAELLMSPGCRKFWDYIKIDPQKWDLSPWGDEGGGFWVVAVVGGSCLYYNDIEEGFNFSSYKSFGRIDEYTCNQSVLLPAIDDFHRRFMREIGGDA
jgi:hypothetical protein